MRLGKKPPEHLHERRTITNQTKWWVDAGVVSKDRLFCVHNVSLAADCEECAQIA